MELLEEKKKAQGKWISCFPFLPRLKEFNIFLFLFFLCVCVLLDIMKGHLLTYTQEGTDSLVKLGHLR